MNPFNKTGLQDRPGLIRICLLLLAGLNLFSAHSMFSVSPILVLGHIIVAVVLLLAAVLIHWARPRQMFVRRS